MDFTLETYKNLLKALITEGYSFQTFQQFLEKSKQRVVVLRHDVDLKPQNSLVTAKIENKMGIVGSYYFRIVPESFNVDIIKEIANFGHEIGYHYETMDEIRGKTEDGRQKTEEAYRLFVQNLETFRQIADIKTICMHGSPRSRYDNREIWKKYNYKMLGIIGEPYFDIDFNQVFYLTDTGRRWDGHKVSVRDKVSSNFNVTFRSTDEIIRRINELPEKVMITIHPQRWNDSFLLWAKELAWQNVKNIVKKRIISAKR
jgi:hypothetical protein